MKKLALVFPLRGALVVLGLILLVQLGCTKKSDPEPPVVPPNTELNSLFNTVYLASNGFQDKAKATPTADGKPVRVIKDLVGDKEIVWAGVEVPSPMWPTPPVYHNDEVGGYILVHNVSETYWATPQFTEIPQPYDVYVVLRDVEAVKYEGYFAVGVGLRNQGDKLELKADSKGKTTSVLMDPKVLDYNKRSIVRIRVDGANSSLWINNVQSTPAKVDLGSGGISYLGYGTNSHAAQHDFYGMWVKFGTLTAEEHTFVYDALVKQYNPGTFPDHPFAKDIKAPWNGKGGWDAQYTYQGTNPEDVTKVQYQWGYYDSRTGELNTSTFFSGASAKSKTLVRSDFPTLFNEPGTGKMLVFVSIKVYDNKGDSWDHLVRSELVFDNVK